MASFFEKLKTKFNKVTAQAAPVEEIETIKQIYQSFQTTARPYDAAQTTRRIELITENMHKWETYIINEASTGLYFTESHNKKSIDLKINRVNNVVNPRLGKKKLILGQIKRTQQEISQIEALAGRWSTDMVQRVTALESTTKNPTPQLIPDKSSATLQS